MKIERSSIFLVETIHETMNNEWENCVCFTWKNVNFVCTLELIMYISAF